MARGGSITIRAILETAKFSKSVDDMKRRLKSLDAGGLDTVDKKADDAAKGMSDVSKEAVGADRAVGKIDGRGLKKVDSAASASAAGLSDVRGSASEAADAVGEIGNAADESRGKVSELTGAMESAASRAGAVGGAIGGGISALVSPATLGIAALGTATAAVGAAAVDVAKSYQDSSSKISAYLGATTEDAERLTEIAKGVWKNGFGESMEDVTDVLVTVKERIRDIDDASLDKVTTAAIVMRDTFDADVGESVKGINALMEGFGLTAEEATDLMAAGMQRGLNFSDELADNLSEYAGRWGEAGMDASKYFSLLEAGAENGAYQLDKVGDFLNEFLTSLSDGRVEEGMANFSKGTQDVFNEFKQGKATAEDVLNAIIGDMSSMTDETKRAQIAGELWSSLGEDNAMGMILAMGGVEDSFGDVAGAAEAMGDAASENLDSKLSTVTRRAQDLLEPVGSYLLDLADDALDFAENVITFIETGDPSVLGEKWQALYEAMRPVGEFIQSVAGYMGDLVNGVMTFIDTGDPSALGPGWQQLYDILQPFVENIMGALSETWDRLQQTFEENEETIQALCTLFEILAGVLGGILLAAVTVAIGVIGGLGEAFSGVMTMIQGVIDFVMGFATIVVGILTGDKDLIDEGVNQMFSGIAGIVGGQFETVVGFIMGAVATILDLLGFHGAADAVRGVFDQIKQFMEDPIENAKNMIFGAIDAIKGFFNFDISWPHVPLPHFGINPPGWQIGDLLQGSIPSLSVDFYANGGYFDKATLLVAGEAGPEMALPLIGRRMAPFAQAVADNMAKESTGDSGVTIVIEKFVHTGSEIDDEALLRRIAAKVKERKRAGGLA